MVGQMGIDGDGFWAEAPGARHLDPVQDQVSGRAGPETQTNQGLTARQAAGVPIHQKELPLPVQQGREQHGAGRGQSGHVIQTAGQDQAPGPGVSRDAVREFLRVVIDGQAHQATGSPGRQGFKIRGRG